MLKLTLFKIKKKEEITNLTKNKQWFLKNFMADICKCSFEFQFVIFFPKINISIKSKF